MDLRVEKISLKNKEVKKIYVDSFPKQERLPFFFMVLLSKMKETDFLAFYNDDIVCGFTYIGTVNNIVFVMFLAVDEAIRSKGYGSIILDKIQSIYPNKKIIISIERCDEDVPNIAQRIKRKKFYEKNGYIDTGYLIELSNTKQEIMIKNGTFDKDEFSQFFKQYSNGSMKPTIWKKTLESSPDKS